METNNALSQEKDISRFSDLEVGKVNSHYHEYAEQHHKGAKPMLSM